MLNHPFNISKAEDCEGMWRVCVLVALRAARDEGYSHIHRELARAELVGTISEFQALSLQAILAIAEESEFANEYLDMAEAVAVSPIELAAISGWRTTSEWLQANSISHAECLDATSSQDEALAIDAELLIELCCVAATDSSVGVNLKRIQAA
jgi:hypothetical protein